MVSRPILCLAVAAALLLPVAAAADVLFMQTLGEKVAASDTIAVAAFVKAEGKAPYTNANPPVAVFRVQTALRGCKVGDLLRVPDWNRRPKPEGRHKSPMPPVPPTEEELRAWAQESVSLPKPGEGAVLLLGGPGPQPLLSGHIPHPNHLGADPGTIAQVIGLLTFSVDVQPVDDQQVELGAPLAFTVTVQNNSKEKKQFDLASLQMNASRPAPGQLDLALRKAAKVAVLDLAPGGSQSAKIDLNQLFPGVFTVAGDYWIDFDLPAQGGQHLRRHVEVVEHSLAYLCGRASQILRVKVKADGHGAVTLGDSVYLRLRGDRLPDQLPWTLPAPLPAGERRIVCADNGKLTFSSLDSQAFRQQLGALVAADPPEWWSRTESADPRFSVPDQGPGSVQRQQELQRRLQELR